MSAHRRAVLRLAIALLPGVLIDRGWAVSDTDALECRIKSAFICKFPTYVEWPANAFARADSPLVIGVVASDAAAEELSRTAAGLSVGGRPIVVRRLERAEMLADVHLVYVGRSRVERLSEILSVAKGKPVLTVTESQAAMPPGSMINFIIVDDKVRFDVAPLAAESNSLKISSRLLSVARQIAKGS